MAIPHTRFKAISRGKRNTVSALAYRTGCQLVDSKEGRSFNYRSKAVQHVELLLPEGTPAWAIHIQQLIAQEREQGVQQFSDIVESAETRKDARVYREFEFALPRELTDEQNIILAKELLQDQVCQKGVSVLACFHFDVDEATGERKPHCHALMLTRRLEEHGLSTKKETDWNQREFAIELRKQFVAYTNFHLRLHGFEGNLDHRSYEERGIDIEPQPKLGRNIQEMERRAGNDVKSLKCKAVTDKGQEYQATKLRNLYRIIKHPEIIFEIITQSQSTFMWGDVQKKLAQYVDDAPLFQRLDAQLKVSKELVFLKNLNAGELKSNLKDTAVYTSKQMLKTELQLVSLAESLSQKQTHKVKAKALKRALQKHNQKLEPLGGLSTDQVKAIQHMVKPNQLSCVVGYAGAGKTTALEVAKNVWEKAGYRVYGLAPTGRAQESLQQNSFKSFTLDWFLKQYEEGRCQFNAKSILVLDEGGMVSTERFYQFLRAVKRLRVKAVIVGDGAQVPAVEAGPAFRLVTKRVGYVKLEQVVRQKESWQKEATILFGQNRTREALQMYKEHGCIRICPEKIPDLENLLQQQDFREVVLFYNLSRRITGNVYYEMRADLKRRYVPEQDCLQHIATHGDYDIYREWRARRGSCARSILDNLDQYRPYLKELGVDPIEFALNFVDQKFPREQQIKIAHQLTKKWHLPTLDVLQKKHICDPRIETKKQIVEDWYQFYRENPASPRLMTSYSNNDVRYLNDQARFLLKQDGVVAKTEFIYTIHRQQDTDFNGTIILQEERAFAKGDRLLFTRNDKGLGVSNGTLGTIESLNRQKIKVRLEGSRKIISFAPRLYPHFDQGWAVTIHKNQSVTTDDTLVLGTFETFRNLAYVGMTRHRNTATLYGSELDFWREEKLLDRLSRSQEKLSSLDYVEPQELLTMMKKDKAIIMRVFNRLGNQFEAIKYVSKRALQEARSHFLDKTYEYEPPIAQDSISEEERARALFENNRKDAYLKDRSVDDDRHSLMIPVTSTSSDQYGLQKLQVRDKEDIYVASTERSSASLVSSSPESRPGTTATSTKEHEAIEASSQVSQDPLQKQELLEQYLALKKERQQYNVVIASPEEKKMILNLRHQINKTAFAITQDPSLMKMAQQQGIAQMIKSDSFYYTRSLSKDKTREPDRGF